MPSRVPVSAISSSSSEIQTSSQAFLGTFTRLSIVSNEIGGESEAFGRSDEELVAVRVLDEVLAGVVDGRFVGSFPAEVVAQIERSQDLFEDLGVAVRLVST